MRRRAPPIIAGALLFASAYFAARSRRAAPASSATSAAAPPPPPQLARLAFAANRTARDHADALAATRLVARIKDELGDFAVECAVPFAYCGRASCKRSKDYPKVGERTFPPLSERSLSLTRLLADAPKLVAACACQSVEASDAMYASVDGADAAAMQMLAQSAAFVAIMEAYLDGGASFDATAARLCASLRAEDGGARGYFGMGAHDRISLPVPDAWNERHPEHTAETLACDGDGVELAIAVCSGAPCYADRAAAGPLNLTCLCPMWPYSGEKTLQVTPAGVGHLGGGCAAYSFESGECVAQSSSRGVLDGDHMREWAVAAVVAAAETLRSEQGEAAAAQDAECRAWFND